MFLGCDRGHIAITSYIVLTRLVFKHVDLFNEYQKPMSGVKAGDIFLTPPPMGYSPPTPEIEAPIGRWRNGLCDCFKYGICSAQLFMAFCFTEGKKTVFLNCRSSNRSIPFTSSNFDSSINRTVVATVPSHLAWWFDTEFHSCHRI